MTEKKTRREIEDERENEEIFKEDKPVVTEEQREKWRRDERKDAILDEIEKQLEKSGKTDTEIAELKTQLIQQVKLNSFWLAVLSNKAWEAILRTYFRVGLGMVKGMCARTVLTIEEKDGRMNFNYEFFDKDGKPVLTEFNKIYKEGEE